MDTYATEYRRMILATVAGYALFLGLAMIVLWFGPNVGSDPVVFLMAIVPLVGLFLIFHAHERFLAAIDEYLRSIHERWFRAGSYFMFALLSIYALRAAVYGFSEDTTGLAVSTVLLAIPLFLSWYLWMARWNVRRDAKADYRADSKANVKS